MNAAPGPKIMLPLKRFKTWCASSAVLAAAAALLAMGGCKKAEEAPAPASSRA